MENKTGIEALEGLDKIKRNASEIRKWINDIRNKNDITEKFFEDQRNEWTSYLRPLYNKLREDVKHLTDISAYALSYRHTLSDEINQYLNIITQLRVEYKKSKADRLHYYTTGFEVKLSNIGEKRTYFEDELAQIERAIQIYESHVEFLRECKDNCDKIGYTIKNKISLLDYLGD